MNWEIDKSSQVIFYTGHADASTSRIEAMQLMWEAFEKEVLPQNEAVSWDYIKAEIWADSGRFIVFPASSQTVNRIEKAGCQIIFSDLLNSYNELADSDMNDDEFCEQLFSMLSLWNKDFLDSAKSSNLSINCKLVVWDAESEELLAESNL